MGVWRLLNVSVIETPKNQASTLHQGITVRKERAHSLPEQKIRTRSVEPSAADNILYLPGWVARYAMHMSLPSDGLEMKNLFRRQIRKRRFQTTPEAQNSDLRRSASSLHRCPNTKVPWESLASHSIALRDENTEPVIRILVLSLKILSILR